MTIREFRDRHQKNMDPALLFAGEFLERLGLIFGYDFTTGDAIDQAAKSLTGQMAETAVEELNAAEEARRATKTALRSNRFENDDWSRRWGGRDETEYM